MSAEDDGLLLNVDGMGGQEVIKSENGSHQDYTQKEDVKDAGKEVKAEQNNEPCTSSSSESDCQVVYGIQATFKVKLRVRVVA